jgi:hypothetical protein
MPRVGDKVMEHFIFDAQQQQEPARPRGDGGLYEASGELKERSGDDIYVSESSIYNKASLHPLLTGALFVGAGLAAAALLRPRRAGNGHAHNTAARRKEGVWPSAAGLPAEG